MHGLLVALAAASASFAPPAVVLQAHIQSEDGGPLRDTWVWVVWERGAPFRFAEGTRRVLNPKARTDAGGRLRLEVPSGFFEERERLALAWQEERGERSHFTALHREDGERLDFSLGELDSAADFGRLIAPDPEPQ